MRTIGVAFILYRGEYIIGDAMPHEITTKNNRHDTKAVLGGDNELLFMFVVWGRGLSQHYIPKGDQWAE